MLQGAGGLARRADISLSDAILVWESVAARCSCVALVVRVPIGDARGPKVH